LADRAPPPRGEGSEGTALSCPHCGASLSLRNPESVTFTCPSCRSVLDGSQGALRILKHIASREQPPIAPGSRGVFDGEQYEVLGWMSRSTEADGSTYYWDEYLLHGKRGYRWLTESTGQWHLVEPIDAGRVTPAPGSWAECDGRRFKHFQD